MPNHYIVEIRIKRNSLDDARDTAREIMETFSQQLGIPDDGDTTVIIYQQHSTRPGPAELLGARQLVDHLVADHHITSRRELVGGLGVLRALHNSLDHTGHNHEEAGHD